jgi:hypothetical protein
MFGTAPQWFNLSIMYSRNSGFMSSPKYPYLSCIYANILPL